MTDEQIAHWKAQIDAMTQEDCARLWRFAPSGHPVFDRSNGDLYDHFKAHFDELGGFTAAISKRIGLER